MAVVDVKITDLDPVNSLKSTDLFLIANPIEAADGVPIAGLPYTSNSISGAALSSTIKSTITSEETLISSEWDYGIKIKVDTPFLDDIKDFTKDNEYIEETYGYRTDNPKLLSSASTIDGKTIVNKDYVDQLTKSIFKDLQNSLKNALYSIYNGNNKILPSYPGQIIHSTTLSSEEAVRNVYGNGQQVIFSFNGIDIMSPDTGWIQHYGYFLRGASASTPNNTSDIVGLDQKTYSVPLKAHRHQNNNVNLSHSHGSGNMRVDVYGWVNYDVENGRGQGVNSVAAPESHRVDGNTSSALGSVTINSGDVETVYGAVPDPTITVDHLPRYKNVYIWERVR